MITLGKLRHQVYTRLAEEYTNKESFKKVFNQIMTVLNENKDLKKAFNIYTDIENRHISSKEVASDFIVEAVNEIKSLMTESYISGTKKLSTIVGNVQCEQNNITKNLDTLVYKNGYDTLVERIESKNYLVSSLTEVKTIEEGFRPVSQSILSNLLVAKFNEKFSVMTEAEQSTFKKYTTMSSKEIAESVNVLKVEVKESIEQLKGNEDLKSVVMEVESKVDSCGTDLLSLIKLEELKNNLS